MDSVEPKLPQDLERRIFELSYYNEGSPDNKRLLLIAKRTRHWLRPLLYRIIYQCFIAGTKEPFPNFQDRPSFVKLHEICSHVKSLAIDNTCHTIVQSGALIEQCHNLENLACWGENSIDLLSSSIQKLPNMRRLSGIFRDFTRDGQIAPVFSTVTHLEILYIIADWPPNILTSFPQLTHLVLNLNVYLNKYPASNLIALQSSCPQLRVFVVPFIQDLPPDYLELYANDQRVLFTRYGILAKDWLSSARGDRDIWWLAETVVIARKSNYFKSNEWQKTPLSIHFALVDHLTEEGKTWYLSL
ncbi:hypothetical protein BJ165DRAFT_1592499 [Panaeolus papilionaceus]|nr:hypothetical protein BJ165DRAFT_1592499 [Panaeolus papilionaceus]